MKADKEKYQELKEKIVAAVKSGEYNHAEVYCALQDMFLSYVLHIYPDFSKEELFEKLSKEIDLMNLQLLQIKTENN